MSQSDAVKIRYAKQTAGLASTPGSLIWLCSEGNPDVTTDDSKLERDLRCGDMEKTAGIAGPKNTGLALTTEAYGCFTAGADGVAAVAPASIKELLESLFGSAGSAATGDTVTASSGVELTVTGNPADDDFVLVEGADSGRKQVRQVTSGGGTTTIDLDRTLTDDDNTAEIGANAVVYGGVKYDLDNTNADRNTLYAHVEGDTTGKELFGLICTALQIELPSDGGKAQFSWTLDGNNWTEVGTLANATYAAEDDGSPVVNVDSPLWIGATMYMVKDLSINVALNAQRKMTQHGVNGFEGHFVAGSTVTVSGTLYAGTSNLEADKTIRPLLNTATTQDLLIQIGREPGACMALRIPAASFLAQDADIDGHDAFSFEATATRTAEDGTSCARLALF